MTIPDLRTVTVRPEHCDPLFLLKELGKGRAYTALLESADRAHGTNDLSFLALGARDVVEVRGGTVRRTGKKPSAVRDPLQPFETIIGQDKGARLQGMGYIGFLSYESARCFDAIDLPTTDVPDGLFFLPEVILRMDHRKREVTIVADSDTAEDLERIKATVERSPFLNDSPDKVIAPAPLPSLGDIEPYRQTTREEFSAKVRKAQEQILAGEAFQSVLSQELALPRTTDPLTTYVNLRRINPSPYMYCFRTPDITIVGASPETLLRVEGRNLLYRPIAGTRKRTGNPDEDRRMEQELLADQKERCEHQMLVDLGRCLLYTSDAADE